MPHEHHMNHEMRQCIANCLNCHSACLETAVHCLMLGGEHASPEHQAMLADCAQACITCAGFMSRLSEHHHRYCEICAEICAACAEDCERLGSGDATMSHCAELCRRCAESCRSMSQHEMA